MKTEATSWPEEDLENSEIVETDIQFDGAFDPNQDPSHGESFDATESGSPTTMSSTRPTCSQASEADGESEHHPPSIRAEQPQLQISITSAPAAVSMQQHVAQAQITLYPHLGQPDGRSRHRQPSSSTSDQEPQDHQQPPPYKKRRKGKLLLWQFLLQALLQGHSNLSWLENQAENPGVFMFRDSNQAARRWGSYKENDNMSYEKMSRCIRDYWIRDDNKYYQVMVPDPQKGRRLHFAFNLQHKDVQEFIQAQSIEYYNSLVDQGLITSCSR